MSRVQAAIKRPFVRHLRVWSSFLVLLLLLLVTFNLSQTLNEIVIADVWNGRAVMATLGNTPTNTPTFTPTATRTPTPTGTQSPTPCAGSLDTSFDGDGIVTTLVGIETAWATSVAIQSDGKIVAVLTLM